MSNLPVVPGVPSSAEVDAMKRAMQAVHGSLPTVHEHQAHYSGGSQGRRAPINESSQPVYHSTYGGTSAEDVQQMKNLLERLEQINGSDNMLAETAPAVQGGSYEVIGVLAEGNATTNYSVVLAGTRQSVVNNLSLQEAALAVAKYLNRGLAVESAKIQQVLELEEDYHRAKVEAGTIKERYNRSVRIGETEAAEVFKKRHSVARANALATVDQIKSILAAIR